MRHDNSAAIRDCQTTPGFGVYRRLPEDRHTIGRDIRRVAPGSASRAGGLHATADAFRQGDPASRGALANGFPATDLCANAEALLGDSAGVQWMGGHEGLHEAAGTAAMVDLDEAAHGLYADAHYVFESMNGNAADSCTSLSGEAYEMGHHPIEWLAHQAAPGDGNLAVTLGLGAVMAPLSFAAMRAGWQEWREAGDTSEALKARGEALRARRDALPQPERLPGVQAPTAGPSQAEAATGPLASARAERHMIDQVLQDLARARRANRLDASIGASSFLSGGAILTKSLGEAGTQGLIALGGKGAPLAPVLNALGGGSAVATASGLASTFVLGPLAGVLASVLGLSFVLRTHQESQMCRSDRALMREPLEALRKGRAAHPSRFVTLRRYRRFLETKLAQRQQFFSRFRNWNIGFFGGASVYGASVLAKAGLAAAALAGLGGIIGAPLLGTLLFAGTVGALVMSISSHRFFVAHDKLKRYHGHAHSDAQDIDRQTLCALDAASRHLPLNESSGFGLRAGLHAQLHAREKHLHAFVLRAAQALGRHYRLPRRSTDASFKGVTFGKRSLRREVHARLAAAGTLAKGLLSLKGKQAASEAARQRFSRESASLTVDAMSDWLADPASLRPQIGFMRSTVDAQCAYLDDKLAILRKATVHPDYREAAIDVEGLPPASAFEASIKRDQLRCARLKRLSQALAAAEQAPVAQAQQALHGLREAFVTLQTGHAQAERASDNRASCRTLARFCLSEAEPYLSSLRGILLSTEQQAARTHARTDTPSA